MDYKLQIFLKVAERLSFSKAAQELHISQPAVTRHIKSLEDYYNQKLFERKGNSIELTRAGSLLFEKGNEIIGIYKGLEFDMNALIDKTEGVLKIAASTTIAQYILPEALALFKKRYPDIKMVLNNANTAQVERNVLDKTADIGFIEGVSRNRELSYKTFLKDEIVLVFYKNHKLFNAKQISLDKLKGTPLVLREEGSGTLEVITSKLKNSGLELSNFKMEVQLGSSESIKSYLKGSEACAFLSVYSVLDELTSGDLGIVDIEDFSIERIFQTIQLQGDHTSIAQVFMNFLEYHYNIKL
ncbi:LysR family transcriptional regulator [Galbibacter sp. BG1]|uniref:LysR family transcriptional regulator n=1 Tax=Galbibacter sp. BG1 TaxID=1170699 RepID=UPI0015BBEA8C|nr:LysR family transcriptional regulator [Galbibacter sp. BG1]QLE02956.1 LysR family transcriptional regulator [Galbibacter sp. BG1]